MYLTHARVDSLVEIVKWEGRCVYVILSAHIPHVNVVVHLKLVTPQLNVLSVQMDFALPLTIQVWTVSVTPKLLSLLGKY